MEDDTIYLSGKPEEIIWWHRINSGDFATKLFDHFLHVKREPIEKPGHGWRAEWSDTEIISMVSMDTAFSFAEQFYQNEMIKRTDEPCL